jgi:large subunit ribosomal protein L29
MSATQFRDLSDDELTVKELELRETVFRFQLRRGTNQLDNPAALRRARRDIARIRTIIGERARAARTGQTQ